MRLALGIARLALVLLVPLHAHADDQSERIKALETKLQDSIRLIEQLSNRIDELERQGRQGRPKSAQHASAGASAAAGAAASASASAPTSVASTARAAPSVASLQDDVDQISQGLSRHDFDLGLPIHGFADVQAGASSDGDPQRLRGFNAGTLDLYLTPQFGNGVRALIEIAFEYDPGERATSIDMERLQLGYTFNDALTLWAGRFHTPFGQWNTTFHHGANLQTSIYRPRFIEFEDRGGIIPAHSVGAWASGRTPLGAGRLTYDAYVANGPTIRDREIDFNPFTDDNGNKMVGFNLGYQPTGQLRGLSAGLHGFTSNVSIHDAMDVLAARSRLRMLGAYTAYEARDWELFAEYYRFSNSTEGGGPRHDSHAGFVHLGRSFGQLTPYVRYERASLDPSDVYFNSQLKGRPYTRGVVGSRYALDAKASFKFELSNTDEAGANQYDGTGIVFTPRSSYRRASVQYSIAF